MTTDMELDESQPSEAIEILGFGTYVSYEKPGDHLEFGGSVSNKWNAGIEDTRPALSSGALEIETEDGGVFYVAEGLIVKVGDYDPSHPDPELRESTTASPRQLERMKLVVGEPIRMAVVSPSGEIKRGESRQVVKSMTQLIPKFGEGYLGSVQSGDPEGDQEFWTYLDGLLQQAKKRGLEGAAVDPAALATAQRVIKNS